MSAQQRLRNHTSLLFERGVDPYNTADSIRVSAELASDFLVWATEPVPQPAPLPNLMRRQAD